MVLTFSYGQASFDIYFSVNNQVLDDNMQMMSIVVRKHIISHMKVNHLTPHSIDISKDHLLSFKDSSTRYRIHLEEEKEKMADIEAENQKAITSSDMAKR